MRQGTASTLGFAFEPFQDLRVGQMTAIPGEEVVGGNGGGNGQVHGVASGFGRQATCGEEEAGQFLGVGADRCARECGQERQSAPDLFWVPPAGFDHDFLGGQAGKARATPLPPVSRYLLVGRCDQVTARIGHQIANNARLNVNSFHLCRSETLLLPALPGQGCGGDTGAGRFAACAGGRAEGKAKG